MTFGELQAFVNANWDKIHPSTKVGVSNHFGELEDTLVELKVQTRPRKEVFIALVGVSSMYPEPD